jgi:hypothetical protein
VDGTDRPLLAPFTLGRIKELPFEDSKHGRVSAYLLRALLQFATRLISDKWYIMNIYLFFSLFGSAFSSSYYIVSNGRLISE